jgi:hypothetical protein
MVTKRVAYQSGTPKIIPEAIKKPLRSGALFIFFTEQVLGDL